MILWKYMHADDIHFYTEDCVLKLSSDRFYRRMYHAMEVPNAFINDPMEGVTVWRQGKAIDMATASQNERRAAQFAAGCFGFRLSESGANILSNNVIQLSSQSFHMVCLTSAEPSKSEDIFCRRREGVEKPYDACLEFGDIHELSRHIWDDGLLMDQNGEFRIPFQDYFYELRGDPVSYAAAICDWSSQAPLPSPFRKDADFKVQQEFRLVASSSNYGEMPDHIFCRAPKLKELVRRVELSGQP